MSSSFSWCWRELSANRRCTLAEGHVGDCEPTPIRRRDAGEKHPKPQPQRQPQRQPPRSVKDRKPSTAARTKHIRSTVDDLLEAQRFRTWVAPDKDKRRETVDRYHDSRRGPARTVTRQHNRQPVQETVSGELLPVPTVSDHEYERRRHGFQFEVECPSLIDELEQLREGNAPRVEMSSGRRAPSSRPPAGADVADLLVDVTVGAAALVREALEQLNRTKETRRLDTRSGRVVPFTPDAPTALRQLAELADDVEEELAAKIAKNLTSWRNSARLLQSVNAPMATLNNVCPVCKEQSLIVRADASTDVVCSNDDCHDENGNQTRWVRSRWAMLLAESAEPQADDGT